MLQVVPIKSPPIRNPENIPEPPIQESQYPQQAMPPSASLSLQYYIHVLASSWELSEAGMTVIFVHMLNQVS